VFTPQELRRGLSKLTKAGYVINAAGIYSLSDAGRAIMDDARQRRRDQLGMWHYIETRLSASRGPEDSPQYEDARFPYPTVTDEAVAEADRQYRANFARLVAELEARER
jgi:hypothetical protein